MSAIRTIANWYYHIAIVAVFSVATHAGLETLIGLQYIEQFMAYTAVYMHEVLKCR